MSESTYSYDPACEGLADLFISDSRIPEAERPECTRELAQEIQSRIEDYMEQHEPEERAMSESTAAVVGRPEQAPSPVGLGGLDERLLWSKSNGHRFVLTNDAHVSRGGSGQPTVTGTCQCVDCGLRWPTYGDLCPMPECQKAPAAEPVPVAAPTPGLERALRDRLERWRIRSGNVDEVQRLELSECIAQVEIDLRSAQSEPAATEQCQDCELYRRQRDQHKQRVFELLAEKESATPYQINQWRDRYPRNGETVRLATGRYITVKEVKGLLSWVAVYDWQGFPHWLHDVFPLDDKKKREPGCKCHQEEGDSPCPVHGENESEPAEPVAPQGDLSKELANAKVRISNQDCMLSNRNARLDANAKRIAELEAQLSVLNQASVSIDQHNRIVDGLPERRRLVDMLNTNTRAHDACIEQRDRLQARVAELKESNLVEAGALRESLGKVTEALRSTKVQLSASEQRAAEDRVELEAWRKTRIDGFVLAGATVEYVRGRHFPIALGATAERYLAAIPKPRAAQPEPELTLADFITEPEVDVPEAIHCLRHALSASGISGTRHYVRDALILLCADPRPSPVAGAPKDKR